MPVRIDYGRPVIDYADAWPFVDNRVKLARGTVYIDSRGILIDDRPLDDQYPLAVNCTDGDSVLGHLTDGRVFVSSREGITAFEARFSNRGR
jgi:hypothetical protein